MSAHRIARGISLTIEAGEDLASRCTAIIAASPAGTIAACRTAAALHGLWLPPSAALQQIDVAVVGHGRAARELAYPRRPEVHAHRHAMPPADVVMVRGVPATSLARTWFDLARHLGLPDLVAAGDCALRSGVEPEQIREVLSRCAGQRGVRLAATALPLLDGRSRSRPESHMRVAALAPDLPAFEVNMSVANEWGEWLAEPDLSLRDARLALEYQGADHADPERMRKDMTRVTDLRRAGWEVLLYGPAEVLRRPHFIAPEIRSILRVRAPHLLLIPGRRVS